MNHECVIRKSMVAILFQEIISCYVCFCFFFRMSLKDHEVPNLHSCQQHLILFWWKCYLSIVSDDYLPEAS